MVVGCLRLSDVSVICRVVNPRRTSQKIWGGFFYRPVEWHWIDFFDSNGKVKSRNPAQRVILVVNFRRSVIFVELWRTEVANFREILHFMEKRILTVKCLKLSSESFHRRVVLKFVKFGQWEMREIVRYLPNKNKTKFRLALQLSLLRGSRLKSDRASPRQCTQSTPDFI